MNKSINQSINQSIKKSKKLQKIEKTNKNQAGLFFF